MNQHRLEAQIEKVQYNQTAVMLLIETCGLVRENTSRAVTSLDNMVLYFMKTKGSENDTSLMGLLHVSELLAVHFVLKQLLVLNVNFFKLYFSWVNFMNQYDGLQL